MIVTLSLVVSLALSQKVEVIRGGTKGKAKKAAASAPAENEANEKAKQLDAKAKALDAREQELGAKEQALDAKDKDLQAKDEEAKAEKEKKKKAHAEEQQTMERQSAANAAAVGDLSRALGGN